MGGLLAHYVSKRFGFRGVIYGAPCFKIPLDGCTKCIISFVACCNPLQLPPPDSEPTFSRNLNVEEEVELDYPPESFSNFGTINMLVQKCNNFVNSKNESHEKAILMIISGVEKIVCLETIVNYYNESKVKDKESILYPNMWHGVLVEDEVYDLMPRMVKWIGDRL